MGLANTKSAKKRIRIAEKRRLRNKSFKSAMKTKIKKFEAALETGNTEEIKAKFMEAYKFIDKVASKGIIHKNAAARRKSRLHKKLNKMLAG
mgnify:CR=1 FL=1